MQSHPVVRHTVILLNRIQDVEALKSSKQVNVLVLYCTCCCKCSTCRYRTHFIPFILEWGIFLTGCHRVRAHILSVLIIKASHHINVPIQQDRTVGISTVCHARLPLVLLWIRTNYLITCVNRISCSDQTTSGQNYFGVRQTGCTHILQTS